MKFFTSYIGMFITQTVLHSFITVIIIEVAVYSLEIKDHFEKFRYRLLILVLPVFMFPVYQIIDTDRGSMYFRGNTAIFDVNRWLAIRIWDIIPVYVLFLGFLLLTAVIFILQEILPIIREKIPGTNYVQSLIPERDLNVVVSGLCKKLNIAQPSVEVVDASYPLLFTSGTKNHTIIISKELLGRLDENQLEAALAHEIVHIKRGSSGKTQLIYLLRMLMFYNPVSLLEFRRLVQDDEFICDSITISVTKNPDALISAIQVFYSHPTEAKASRISMIKDSIESHSHNLMLKERIEGIQAMETASYRRFGWKKFILTTVIILTVNYMVV